MTPYERRGNREVAALIERDRWLRSRRRDRVRLTSRRLGWRGHLWAIAEGVLGALVLVGTIVLWAIALNMAASPQEPKTAPSEAQRQIRGSHRGPLVVPPSQALPGRAEVRL